MEEQSTSFETESYLLSKYQKLGFSIFSYQLKIKQKLVNSYQFFNDTIVVNFYHYELSSLRALLLCVMENFSLSELLSRSLQSSLEKKRRDPVSFLSSFYCGTLFSTDWKLVKSHDELTTKNQIWDKAPFRECFLMSTNEACTFPRTVSQVKPCC